VDNRPLVSIIIPNFNYGRYLSFAVDSALGQTYRNIETIVVDDGSTDNSRARIASYGNRVRAIFKTNGGQTSSCNAGYAASRGDIVHFLDADDLLRPEAIDRIVAAMRRGVAAVQTPVMAIDASGKLLGSILPLLPPNWTPERIRRTVRRTGIYPHPPTSGNAYARWFLDRILPLSTARVPCGVDGVLNGMAAYHGDVVVLPDPLAYYRFHDANMGAAIKIQPETLKHFLLLSLMRNAVLVLEARRCGVSLEPAILERDFYFAQYRLASLKVWPERHPIGGDTLVRVILRFLQAGAVAPDRALRRAFIVAWGLALVLAPRSLADDLVSLRFSSGERPSSLERLFRALRLVGRTGGYRIAAAGVTKSSDSRPPPDTRIRPPLPSSTPRP
jgi:glycosyltransferase involved in cell wall biosynthesis